MSLRREPSTLSRDISPPPKRNIPARDMREQKPGPSLAAIEAGRTEIRNHLDYFAQHFLQVLRTRPGPRISIKEFEALYQRNEHKHGHHFVIHQHDHPISGVHYDLRLQFSETSTISFAIPYGMPGNPNSSRPNRMAIETRVHNLWVGAMDSSHYRTTPLSAAFLVNLLPKLRTRSN